MERISVLILIVFTLLVVLGYARNVLLYHDDCYMPPDAICAYYKCSSAGLNYSRVARHEGASGYDCFCLNGTEEVVR